MDAKKLLTLGAVGVGVVLFAPALVGVAAEAGKPLVKGLIKGGIILTERGRIVAAEALETLEDLAAEVRSELDQEKAGEPEAETGDPA